MWFEKMHMGARLTRGRLLTVVFCHPNCQRSFPDSSVGKESTCNAGEPSSIPGSGRSTGEGIGYPHQYAWLPLCSADEESACNAGDLGSILVLGSSPGERKGYPLQYSGLENSMDCIVDGVAKSQPRLSNFHFHKLGG